MNNNNDFELLVDKIEYTERILQNNARLIINRHVTAKAWIIGYYIVEYEQRGNDRAKYGEFLLKNLSKRLGKKYAFSTLKLYRQFYLIYPQLQREIRSFLVDSSIGQSVISQLATSESIGQSVISQLGSNQNLNIDSKHEITIAPE